MSENRSNNPSLNSSFTTSTEQQLKFFKEMSNNAIQKINDLETLLEFSDNTIEKVSKCESIKVALIFLHNHLRHVAEYLSQNTDIQVIPLPEVTLSRVTPENQNPPDSPSNLSITPLGEEESSVSSEIDSSDNDTELTVSKQFSPPSDSSSHSQQTSTSEEILPSHTDSPSNLLITPLGEEELPVSSEIDSSDNDTELTVSKQFSPPSDSSSHSQQTSTSEEILPSHTDSSSKFSRHYYCTSILDEPRTSRESPHMSDNSTSGRSTSPVPMIPITRMRTIGKYHESLKSHFETSLKSLHQPTFSNYCIELQRLLIHLFLHLLRDVEDFIGFFDGKEPSDSFEASQPPTISRLESVRSDFASEFRIEETNDFLRQYTSESFVIEFKFPEEITGQQFELPGDHFKHTDSDSVSDDFGSILLTWNRNTSRDELETNLEFIINLNEELISLLCLYRDSIRAILEYCYQRKLSIVDPRVKEVLKNIMSLAFSLQKYRKIYKMELEEYNETLVLKVKIAYELKQILKARLAENLKFWN